MLATGLAITCQAPAHSMWCSRIFARHSSPIVNRSGWLPRERERREPPIHCVRARTLHLSERRGAGGTDTRPALLEAPALDHQLQPLRVEGVGELEGACGHEHVDGVVDCDAARPKHLRAREGGRRHQSQLRRVGGRAGRGARGDVRTATACSSTTSDAAISRSDASSPTDAGEISKTSSRLPSYSICP